MADLLMLSKQSTQDNNKSITNKNKEIRLWQNLKDKIDVKNQ